MFISIVIPTRNRPEKIKLLCNSLNDVVLPKKKEIIFIDQNHDETTRKVINSVIDSKKSIIRYFKTDLKGQSNALNLGIRSAKGDIIAITHDDCIVDKNWLINILVFFKRNKDMVCLFGKVLPYTKTQKPLHNCPSITVRNKKVIVSNVCNVWEKLGAGNNLSLKKEAFLKTEGFKSWLGVGTFLSCGEDQDFALELLKKGYKVGYSPKVKIWHNRWINKKEHEILIRRYDIGTYACYAYQLLAGVRVKDFLYIDDYFRELRKDFRKAILRSFKDKRLHRYTWLELLLKIWNFRYQVLGHILGLFYFYKGRVN